MLNSDLRPRGSDRSIAPSRAITKSDPFSKCMNCNISLSGITKIPKVIDDLSIILNCGHVLCSKCIYICDSASVNVLRPAHCQHDFKCCICCLMSPPITIPNNVRVCEKRYAGDDEINNCVCEICWPPNNNSTTGRKTLNNIAYCGMHQEKAITAFCSQCGKHLCPLCIENHRDEFNNTNHTLIDISSDNPKLEDLLFQGDVIHGNLQSLKYEAQKALHSFLSRSGNLKNSVGCYFISILNAAIGRFCQLNAAIQLEEGKMRENVNKIIESIGEAQKRIEIGKEMDDLARSKSLMPEQHVSDCYKMSAQKIFQGTINLREKAYQEVNILKSQNIHLTTYNEAIDIVREITTVFPDFTVSNSSRSENFKLQPCSKLYSPTGNLVLEIPPVVWKLRNYDFSTYSGVAKLDEDGISRFRAVMNGCGLKSPNLSRLHPSFFPIKINETRHTSSESMDTSLSVRTSKQISSSNVPHLEGIDRKMQKKSNLVYRCERQAPPVPLITIEIRDSKNDLLKEQSTADAAEMSQITKVALATTPPPPQASDVKDPMSRSISNEFMRKLYHSALYEALSPDHQFYVLKQAQQMQEAEDQRRKNTQFSETDHIVILKINEAKLQTLITKLLNSDKSATKSTPLFNMSTEPSCKLSSKSTITPDNNHTSSSAILPSPSTEAKTEIEEEIEKKPDVEKMNNEINNSIVVNIREEEKPMLIEPPTIISNGNSIKNEPKLPLSYSKVEEPTEFAQSTMPSIDECRQSQSIEVTDDRESIRSIDDCGTHLRCFICNQKVIKKGTGACKTCPRVFHKLCTIPKLRVSWNKAENWQCILCTQIPAEIENESKTMMTDRNRFLCQTVLVKCFGTKSTSLLRKAYAAPHKTLEIVGQRLEKNHRNAYTTVDAFIGAMNSVLINLSTYRLEGTDKEKTVNKVWMLYREAVKTHLPDFLTKVWVYSSLHGSSCTKRKLTDHEFNPCKRTKCAQSQSPSQL